MYDLCPPKVDHFPPKVGHIYSQESVGNKLAYGLTLKPISATGIIDVLFAGNGTRNDCNVMFDIFGTRNDRNVMFDI